MTRQRTVKAVLIFTFVSIGVCFTFRRHVSEITSRSNNKSEELGFHHLLDDLEQKVSELESNLQQITEDRAGTPLEMPNAADEEVINFACSGDATKVTLEMLPSSIVEMGVDVLGSLDALTRLLRNAAPPGFVNIGGLPLCIFSDRSDDSIARLKAEFPSNSDVYGAKQVHKGDAGVVVDIGANLGAFTIFTALLHPQMQIISLEPTPPTYFFFRCNLFLNKIKVLSSRRLKSRKNPGVLALHGAAGTEGGTIEISWDPSKTQNAAAGTNEPSVSAQGWQKRTVTRYPIRSYLEGPQVIKIFKIDCEGCEFSVIPGLADIIANKTKVEKLVGEYHLSLLNENEETFAKKPSAKSAGQTQKVLLERGCRRAWQISC